MEITRCIGDGNCLFHAISNCCYSAYRDLDSKREKQKFALNIRRLTREALKVPEVREAIQEEFPGLFSMQKPSVVFRSLSKQLEGSTALMYYFAHIFALVVNLLKDKKIKFVIVRDGKPLLFEPDENYQYGILVMGPNHYDCVSGLHSVNSEVIKALNSDDDKK